MISVCMATYNGERFIEAQLTSILSQLGEHDEVIVVDDRSSDQTLNTIKAIGDSRVSIYENRQNMGPIGSFERALQEAHGEVIFLSDQDDVWHANKVETVMKAFDDSGAALVVHDATVTAPDLTPIEASWNAFNHNRFSSRLGRTLLKNPYTGAMMAFTREVKEKCLPFPPHVPMHDWWIAAVCQQDDLKINVLSAKLMDYRRHPGSVTGHGHHLSAMIESRWVMLKLLALRGRSREVK